MKSFEVLFRAKNLTFYDTWDQNVILTADLTPELEAANIAANKALKDPQTDKPIFAPPCERPHASLLYGEHGKDVREKAASWVRHEAPWVDDEWSFEAKGLALYETDGGPVRYV